MTIRNLDRLLAPKSVALIGASREEGSVGLITARNLLRGGFAGPVWLVNPKYRDIEGHPCHPSIADLPDAPQLAVVATPPQTIPGIIGELGSSGTRAAVVITAGVRDHLKCAMLEAARPWPAHPGPELPRVDGAGAGPQRRLLARGTACGRSLIPV